MTDMTAHAASVAEAQLPPLTAGPHRQRIGLISIVACLGGLLFGYDTGVANGAEGPMAQELGLSLLQLGIVISSLIFAAAVGALVGGKLSDAIGRRTTILLLAVLFFVGVLFVVFSPAGPEPGTFSPTGFGVLVTGRIILGLAVGGASTVVPVFLAELAPYEIRGSITGRNELAIVTGQLAAFVCNAIIGTVWGHVDGVWRFMFGVCALPAIALFIGMLRMPESPRWLVEKGRHDEALAVLKTVRSEDRAIAELGQVELIAEEEKAEHVIGWKAIGMTIADRFRLKRLIGVGGTGWVWEAKDLHTKEFVALKVLRDDVAEDLITQARFRREADTVATPDHPGIARFVDYGHFADPVLMPGQTITYLATEFIRGEPLDAVIHKKGKLPLNRALDILEATSRALGHAHAAGVVHRDVKPANILITKDGTPKLTDFGIARISGEATLTHAGTVMGTALYVSPEQALGDAVTPASDVYSLSVVGYEMITGKPLFTGEGPLAIAIGHIEDEPTPLPDEAGVRIQALIARALSKSPGHRPQDGIQFAEEIAVARQPVSTPHAGAPAPARAPSVDDAKLGIHTQLRPNKKSPETTVMPIVEHTPVVSKVSRRLKKMRRK